MEKIVIAACTRQQQKKQREKPQTVNTFTNGLFSVSLKVICDEKKTAFISILFGTIRNMYPCCLYMYFDAYTTHKNENVADLFPVISLWILLVLVIDSVFFVSSHFVQKIFLHMILLMKQKRQHVVQ